MRHFGLLMAAVVVGLFGGLLPWLFSADWPWWPWLLGGAFALSAVVRPQWLAPVYTLWLRFGRIMAVVNSFIILGLIFYGLITPIGLVMRVLRIDPLHRPPQYPESFRSVSRARPPQQMEKPF